MGKGEVQTGLLWGDLSERDSLEYLNVDGRINLKRNIWAYERKIKHGGLKTMKNWTNR